MEELKPIIEEAEERLGVLREKLGKKQFLTEAERDELFQLLDRLLLRQKICMSDAGVEGCTSLEDLENLLHQKTAKLDELRRLADDIVSIQVSSDKYACALSKIQRELAGQSDDALIKMEQDGTLVPYRKLLECVTTGQVTQEDGLYMAECFGPEIALAATLRMLHIPDGAPANPPQSEMTGTQSEPQKPEQPSDTAPQSGTKASDEQVAPLAPIRRRDVNQGAFRRDIAKLPTVARILLPVLSHTGAFNQEFLLLLSDLMRWDGGEADWETYTLQVNETLVRMAEKGLIAVYPTEKYGDVYCLTSFSYESMHKQTFLKEAGRLFSIPCLAGEAFGISVGNHRLIARESMSMEELFSAMDYNMAVGRFLSCLNRIWTQYHNEESFEKVCKTLQWKNDRYQLDLWMDDGELISAILFFEKDSQPDPKYGAVFLQDSPDAHLLTMTERPVFWSDGDAVYRWKDGWIPLDGSFGAEGESEEAVESEEQSSEPDEAESSDSIAPLDNGGDPENAGDGSPDTASEPSGESPAPDVDFQHFSAQGNARVMLADKRPVQLDQLVGLMVQLLAEERYAETGVLAEILAKAPKLDSSLQNFYAAFCQSFGVMDCHTQYNSSVIDEQLRVLTDTEEPLQGLQKTLILSTLLWTLVFPSSEFDQPLYNTMEVNAELPPYLAGPVRELTSLLKNDLKEISFQNDGLGFSGNVLSYLSNNGERERQIQELSRRAGELKRTPTSTVGISGLEDCLKQMVGPASSIGKAIQVVEQDDRSRLGEIRECLEQYTDLPGMYMTDALLEQSIDRCWNELRRRDRTIKIKKLTKDSPAQRVCAKALSVRIDVLRQWLILAEADQDSRFESFREGYRRVLNKVRTALAAVSRAICENNPKDNYARASQNVLGVTIRRIQAALEGEAPGDTGFYYDLALYPSLMLDSDGTNVIVPALYGVSGMEPWVFLLQAIAAGPRRADDILGGIDDYKNADWYRNYGSEALLLAYTKQLPVDRTAAIASARQAMEQELSDFRSNIRLNRAYGKLQEQTIETISTVLERANKFYSATHNFASFHGFLVRLNSLMEQEIGEKAELYQKRVSQLKANDSYRGAPMFELIDKALENRNFISLDSYINLLQNGELELPDSERNTMRQCSFFLQFQECEDGYYKECQKRKSSNVAAFGAEALRSLGKKYHHWTSTNEQSKGFAWLTNWIAGRDASNTGGKICALLLGLGFAVDNVKKIAGMTGSVSYELFDVAAKRTSTGLKDYPDPIYKFGTQLSEPMNVVCLYGCKGASTLIDIMANKLQLNGSTIVLMDGSLTATDRHSVAEKFKANTSGQSPFLLIDRVLLLYLASLDAGDRKDAMLQCTLPYTFEVLYGDGKSKVPEEMFIGRAQEMNSLRDDQGADLVYGGRQLGKTALLLRASKTLHNPAQKEYSFHIEVKDEGSHALLQNVNLELKKLGLLKAPCGTIKELCETMQGLYDSGTVRRLKIFVDEVDALFEEFQQDKFKGLRPFIVMRDKTDNHVKFVFAGTHNVAATDCVEEGNNNLLHMGKALCIEPLSSNDATNLIRRPMSYLGFQIGDSQIDLILSNTNSYPGLIHMFCNALIQSVCRDYDRYYGVSGNRENPPYIISDEQMLAVFKEKDIRKEIGTRVMATVRLNRKYYMISCMLAQMIYEDQERDEPRLYGYSAREMLDYNQAGLNLDALARTSEKNLENLLNEMTRMGILWKNDRYRQFRFRQQDFLSFIGTSDDVLTALCSFEEATV